MTPARCAALLLVVLAPLGVATSASAHLFGTGPGGINNATPGLTSNDIKIGLARGPDGTLHLLWPDEHLILHTEFTPDPPDIDNRVVERYGTVGEGGMANETVAVVRDGGGLRAFFAGHSEGHPRDSVLATATWTFGADEWQVQSTPASDGRAGTRSNVFAAAGIGATMLPNGPISVWGDTAPAGYHIGLSSNVADTPFGEEGGLVSEPNVAVDAATGQAWLAWNDVTNETVWVAPLAAPAQTVAPPFADSTDGRKRVSITGRIGGRAGTDPPGGIFVAYPRGTNLFRAKPAVWRVGSDSPMSFPSFSHPNAPDAFDYARFVGVTPAPNGRIWAYWGRPGNNWVYATRSNTKATTFGPVTAHGLPGEWDMYGLEADGSQGPLDVLALADRGSLHGPTLGNWHHRILPPLKLSATVDGRSILFKVVDVGQPVNNAKVIVADHSGFTNEKGKVTFRGIPVGTHKALAKKKDYERAGRKVTVEGR